MQLITNIAAVLFNWQNALLSKYPGLHIAYSESLDYRDSAVEIRSQNLVWDKTNPSFSALTYTRSKPLDWATTHRAAKISAHEYDALAGNVKIYKSWYGNLDIDFLYVASKPIELDTFEIMYHAEDGISSIDSFQVDLTKTYNLGAWEYQCIWNEELSLLEVKYGETYYKAVKGSLKIDGIYHIYDTTSGRIESINFDIFSYDGLVANSSLIHSEVIT